MYLLGTVMVMVTILRLGSHHGRIDVRQRYGHGHPSRHNAPQPDAYLAMTSPLSLPPSPQIPSRAAHSSTLKTPPRIAGCHQIGDDAAARRGMRKRQERGGGIGG
jgi:hypothetical protein